MYIWDGRPSPTLQITGVQAEYKPLEGMIPSNHHQRLDSAAIPASIEIV
jgi:hypothetical protein